MAHTLHHTPAFPAPAYPKPLSEILTSRQISWGVILLLAWLGWPIAREFLMWVLLKSYDFYITYVH
ncbi:hypothetical protein WJU16_22775 [Chitinophaga pollutisoli]|uniref:Fatty acid desaturase n=1 Tax=Chitinophaga pollutisoli TaxID=3133966 RepID=A0ABZ2YPM1_9BACT